MAPGNMAGFVGHDPDHLARMFGANEQTRMQKHPLPPGHKGIQSGIADDVQLHILGNQAGGKENRRRVNAKRIFYFRIANKGYF